jgi:hypothetical protein
MYIKSPEVRELAQRAFPSYNGNHYRVEPFAGPMTTTSCWNGGSRDYWCLVNLVTNKTWHVPENGNAFVNGGKSFKVGRLPENIALIRYQMGGYNAIIIYLNPANIRAAMLPKKPELTWPQSVVLVATKSLKSSYGGRKNIRFTEANERTGITTQEWETAKAECIAKGLLNRAGAITDDGRNTVELCIGPLANLYYEQLKRPVAAAVSELPAIEFVNIQSAGGQDWLKKQILEA